MKAEWESSKLAHEATRAEFESYKVGYSAEEFSIFVIQQKQREHPQALCHVIMTSYEHISLVTSQHFSDQTRAYLALGNGDSALIGSTEDTMCCASEKLLKNNEAQLGFYIVVDFHFSRRVFNMIFFCIEPVESADYVVYM